MVDINLIPRAVQLSRDHRVTIKELDRDFQSFLCEEDYVYKTYGEHDELIGVEYNYIEHVCDIRDIDDRLTFHVQYCIDMRRDHQVRYKVYYQISKCNTKFWVMSSPFRVKFSKLRNLEYSSLTPQYHHTPRRMR